MPSYDTSLGLQLEDVSLRLPFVSSLELDACDRCWIDSPTETDTPGHQLAQVVTVQASGFCMAPLALLLDYAG